jgi:cytochrome c oxidase assembly factor CtaG
MYYGSSPITWPLGLALILLALLYSLGWYHLRKDLPNSQLRPTAFLGGLTSIAAVWTTPLAHLDHHSLTAHMLQHLVLMTVAAPLILLAEPGDLLLGSFPRRVRQLSAQLLELAPIRTLRSLFAHPLPCWFAGTGCVILWHVPALFELGMRSEWWHGFEQVNFLAAGLLFWWPVIRQRSVATRPRWSIPLYLFLATLPCDALSAFLTFCGRVVYSSYVSGPGLFESSALRDQEFAGAMMWVWVTFVYLVPAVMITIEGLSPSKPLPSGMRLQTKPIWVSRVGS